MKVALRNVTVTLEEDVARWARLEAARHDTSVSRFLGGILRKRMMESEQYGKSMRRYLARESFVEKQGRYLSREEAHDRDRLR